MNASDRHEVVSRFFRLGGVFAALLAAVMICASLSSAQSAASSTSAASAKPAAGSPAVKSPSKGSEEGVKVHGHWTIVVKNPDGSIAARRNFENSLDMGGMFILQNLLAGTAVPGAWAISLGAQLPGNTGPCPGGVSFLTYPNNSPAGETSSGNCTVIKQISDYDTTSACDSSAGCFTGLTSLPGSFAITIFPGTPGSANPPIPPTVATQSVTASGFQLSGTATANAAGTIDTVASTLMTCTNGILFTISPGNPTTTYKVIGTPKLNTSECAAGQESRVGFPGALSNLLAGSPSSPFGTVFSSTILNGTSATSTPPAPVNVVANQTIQVSVVFTFN